MQDINLSKQHREELIELCESLKIKSPEPLGKNYLTTKTSNGIITYYFEEDCQQEENGVFFRLLVVPEAGYYSEGNIYYLEPGVYIHSYFPEFNPPHNFKITFSK